LHEEKPPEGAARYLLTANTHLPHALRFRGNRWLVRGKWTEADGLVDPPAAAREALATHRLNVHPTSATALHAYAACPYRYFLRAVHRLEPREEPRPLEVLDARQRGSLVHDIHFAALGAMRRDGLLPVRPSNLNEATVRLDAAVDRVAAEYREKLVPAIDRVWDDGIEAIRTDLRQWLRQLAGNDSGFVPWRFELSFGLPRRASQDPESRTDPVEVEGALVRGSIDLVERREDGTLRVTDHKTGKDRTKRGAVVQGGEQVQPVLYAMASEKLFPGSQVLSGRLHYCTAAGGFAIHEVPLDDGARASIERIFAFVDGDLERAFLPAFPREGACEFCDYLRVCGPSEEVRTRRKKDLARVESALELREMP
jgi:RecB family exonuclease